MKLRSLFAAVCATALVAVSAFAQASEVRYIVLLKQNPSAIKNFANDVESAGGTVVNVIEEIGIGIASSANPDFKSALSAMSGIQEVAHSLPFERDDNNMAEIGPAADINHIGEDEFFYPIQWGLDAVNAPAAWDAGLTGAGARVAVLDSGIDHDNADLAPNLNEALSISFMPCVFGLNCDGAVEDWRVREVTTGPFFNHGTHVAGTIAAADGGGAGIGVAPDAEIVAVKVCTEFSNFCFDEAILPGIVHAANVGADVINMSLGGISNRNPSDLCKLIRDLDLGIPCGQIVSDQRAIQNAYKRAFHYANQQGTTVIVSAGNSALDGDNSGSLMFNFADYPNVIGISALGPVGSALPAVIGDAPAAPLAGPDTLAYYSNFGRSIIDFGAPGGNAFLFFNVPDPLNTFCVKDIFFARCYLFDMVLSNAPGDFFFFAQGTSMSAPHASGVAAIIIADNGGDMNPSLVRQAMQRYADDLGQPGKDKVFGNGRVNAGNVAE